MVCWERVEWVHRGPGANRTDPEARGSGRRRRSKITARWRLRPHDPTRIADLSRSAGVPPLVAQLLLNRGIADAAGATRFLEARQKSLHDPETLPGAVEAADRIVRAVRAGRKVVIYGDYDV